MVCSAGLQARLCNWVKLVRTAIEAEVPSFEMLHTVASFLNKTSADGESDTIATRLAKFFGFNADARLSN